MDETDSGSAAPRLQTKSDVRRLLGAAGVRPRRRFGQNFLIDGNKLRALLASADVGSGDVVLVVGAGTGALTEQLAQLAGALVAVEIDPTLCDIVASRVADFAHVELIRGDVLASKHRIADEVIGALHRAMRRASDSVKLVANLPYNVATPLLVDLLLCPVRFQRFCFTVQAEVASRLQAKPGTHDYGHVSVVLQATSDVRRVAHLPPQCFWPPPEVESAMMRVDVQSNPFGSLERWRGFVELVRAAFAHRRKTLRFNLSRAAGAGAVRLAAPHWDLTRRPETLTVPEWIQLADVVLEGDFPPRA